MPSAPKPASEPLRLKALERYQILDSEAEELFDGIAKLAAAICNVPVALITFVDQQRQWFKSKVGVDLSETSRDAAFCAHAILSPNEVLIVPDATKDDRFSDNPLVTGHPEIRFYAGAPIQSSDQHALGTLCVIDSQPRDLSDQQIEALRILSRQVQSNLELRLKKRELEELNASKNRLFSIISHDLRSPLNSIISISEMLAEEPELFDPSESKNFLAHLHRSAGTTLQITENLLRMAEFETGRLRIKPESVRIADALETTVGSLSGKAQAKDIELSIDCPPDIEAWVDPTMLQSILQNLVANAIKFTQQNGRISVVARNLGHLQRVTVTDNGVGMKPDVLASLFQLESTYSTEGTAGEKGSGLGLSLCKQFAIAMGGDLSVESEYGKGAIATVTLPAQPVEADTLVPDPSLSDA